MCTHAFQHGIQQAARIHADHELAVARACRAHRFGGHRDHLGIGMCACRPDRVCVALQELTKAPRPRLFVAPDRTGSITPEGLWQRLPVFGGKAGKRRCQVIAQRDPLLVIILHRENAGIRAVIIGQELAERVGIFPGACLKGFKTPAAIDRGDAVDHLRLRVDQGFALVGKAARLAGEILAGLWSVLILGLLAHVSSRVWSLVASLRRSRSGCEARRGGRDARPGVGLSASGGSMCGDEHLREAQPDRFAPRSARHAW